MSRIRFLVMDVDGTLTNGKIYIGNNGEVMKAFSAKDGCGIHDVLPNMGITPVIITGRNSRIVENRCAELGITELYQGIKDKLTTLNNLLERYHGSYSEVAYIGDDINDRECITAVRAGGGIIGCPADAVAEIKALAHFIAPHNGGDGAVRDFIESLSDR